MMDQIFNELSLSGEHDEKLNALKALHDVYRASQVLVSVGFSRSIRTTMDFRQRELAKGYTCNDWINDKSAPQQYRELRSAMLSQLSKSPYVEELCATHDISTLHEYTIDTMPCLGLGLANIWGVPALSLAGSKRFQAYSVEIVKTTLEESGDIFLKTRHLIELIKNIDDVERLRRSLHDKLYPILSGSDIVKNASNIFKYIVFSETAEKQLHDFQKGHVYIGKLKKIIQELNQEIQISTNTAFNPSTLDYASSESETVRKSPKLSQQRTFMFPDGNSRLCLAHVRIDDFYRMHLFPDLINKKIYIGYIGKHLETANY